MPLHRASSALEDLRLVIGLRKCLRLHQIEIRHLRDRLDLIN